VTRRAAKAAKVTEAVEAAQPIIRPEDCATALKKLNRFSGQTTGSSFVLERAKWAIEVLVDVSQDPSEQIHLERFRDWFAQGSSTLEALDLSEEARLALNFALQASFHIGVLKGNLEQALSAREGMPRARVAPARQEQALIVPRQAERALEICAKNGWSLAKPQKAKTMEKVAKKMGVSERTAYRYLAARK
jgi:hypothetical protein